MLSPELPGRNYVENVLYYRCFFRNLAKIYRTAILKNYFGCMPSKYQWSTHPVVSLTD